VRSGLPADEWKIVPLADEAATVFSVPESAKVYLGSPTITCLPGGRIVVAVDQAGPGVAKLPGGKGQLYHSHHWVQGKIFVSQDKGQTWTQRGEFPFCNACLFRDGESLYLLGHRGTIEIMKSSDGGQTWGKTGELTTRDAVGSNYVQGPANVLHAGGFIYAPFMRGTKPGQRRSSSSTRAVDILRTPEGSVLTSRKSWTTLPDGPTFSDLVPVDEFDYFGVPFYGRPLSPKGKKEHTPRRLGWGDVHLLRIDDPQHIWSDSDGKSFHLLARAAAYRGNIAALAKVTGAGTGKLSIAPETTPAGVKQAFLSLPGGNLRFHAIFDDISGLFWLLSSQVTDSMRRSDRGQGRMRGLPCDERHRLQLHFSKNLVDWCFAGFVSIGSDRSDARNDAQMAVRGDDLCVAICSGATVLCGVIPAFRDLVY